LVKRLAPKKPLTLAFLGGGELSSKMTESMLADYTAPFEEVTVILPVDDAYWSPAIESVYDWVSANDVPFVAVTSGGTPSKDLVAVLEAADNVQKVARISIKMVQLLQQEAAESEVALFVFWDDDDEEAVLAVNKALAGEVRAYNMLDGLDEFTFDDDEPEAANPVSEEDEPADRKSRDAHTSEESDPDEGKFGPADEYDDWGIRKLRAALRERKDDHDIPERTIGQLEKDDAIRALRNIDNGAGKPEPKAESGKIAEKIINASKEERTTRARRAFAEGAAEGTEDEAQALPRSRGGDVLADQDDDLDPNPKQATIDAEEAEETAAEAAGFGINDSSLRMEALRLAIGGGKSGVEAVSDAMRYETYLKGQRQSGGRPRADGSPAQAREIGENGKPVRRRRASSTD